MLQNSLVILVLLNIKVIIMKIKKLGYGKLYNKKNELVYEGEWYFDQPVNATKLVVTEVFKENAIHFGIEELIIDDNVKNNIKSFTMNGFINSIR